MDNKKKIILIGGAPTTGKSTLAQSLSEYLKLPWISTDQIRDLVRGIVNRKDFPNIYTPEGYTAERFLTEFSAEKIVNMTIEEGEALWSIVKKFIEDAYSWPKGFIIEGVGVLPHLIKNLESDDLIYSIFIVDEDADRIRNVVFTRGLWDDADAYSDDVKEKEVEWALLFSHYIKKEADKCSLPWIEVNKNEDDLQAVLSALKIQK